MSVVNEETPPRAWGRPIRHKSTFAKIGNTPTCVGKTRRMDDLHPGKQKHPHVRGEDSSKTMRTRLPLETPPRAWGRRLSCTSAFIFPRNTPTCVGKTRFPTSTWLNLWKHPHVRGEDGNAQCVGVNMKETPPRAWGRPVTSFILITSFGNTPTCVGKTLFKFLVKLDLRKHPHVRGEDFPLFYERPVFSETPPRAWGRPLSL